MDLLVSKKRLMLKLPKELWTEVASYLEFKDLDNLQIVIDDNIDWNYLMMVNFQKFVSRDLINYNVKYIYYDLLLHKNLEHVAFIETAEYIVCNDLWIPKDRELFFDSVKIFKKLLSHIQKREELYGTKGEYFFSYIIHNFHNIIKYIMDNDLIEEEKMFYIIVDAHDTDQDQNNISFETTKLCFGHINMTAKSTIGLLVTLYTMSNSKSFDYLLGILPVPEDIEDIMEFTGLFTQIVGDFHIHIHCNFIKLWEKFGNLFSPKQIISIRRGLCKPPDSGEIPGLTKVDIKNILEFLEGKYDYLRNSDNSEHSDDDS